MNLRIATNERRKRDGEWVDHTEWHSVVIYGRVAEIVGDYVSKGDMISVDGRIQTRQWEDKEGNQRYTTEIVAEDVIFGFGGSGGDNDELPF